MDNLDGSLASLAQEINGLHAQTKSTQEAMGLKLLEARKLLAARNGERPDGLRGMDGLNPIGWGKWVEENLACSLTQVRQAMRVALNPEGTLRRHADKQWKHRRSVAYLINAIKRVWGGLSEDDRNRVLDVMVSLSEIPNELA